MMFRENEDAVSPVIGVILMVAITVILAAVIAAFVFGMAGDMDSQKEVYATTKLSTDADGVNQILILTLQGGRGIHLINYIECLVAGKTDTEASPQRFKGLDTSASDIIEVGKSGSVELTGFGLTDGEECTLIIRATFKDNSQKIIVEMPYTQPVPKPEPDGGTEG
jgi:flagellin-like protein